MTTKQWHNSVSSNVAVVCAPILAQHLILCNWHRIHICLTSGAIFYTQMYVCSQSVAWSGFATLQLHFWETTKSIKVSLDACVGAWKTELNLYLLCTELSSPLDTEVLHIPWDCPATLKKPLVAKDRRAINPYKKACLKYTFPELDLR